MPKPKGVFAVVPLWTLTKTREGFVDTKEQKRYQKRGGNIVTQNTARKQFIELCNTEPQ